MLLELSSGAWRGYTERIKLLRNLSQSGLKTGAMEYQALVVRRTESGAVSRTWETRSTVDLPTNHLRIRIQYSSLNYKDALAASGHPGVARQLPLVPGIDAAGQVIESSCSRFAVGDPVLVFHADFGTAVDGGYAELVTVPEEWVYPLPQGISPLDAMTIGTGGFTAAQSVDAILKHGITPADGEVVVSGATGGVGVFAVMLFSRLGFQVVASTGKPERAQWLRELGAAQIVDRQTLLGDLKKPLLSARWAAAVDTVGGQCLSTLLRSTQPHHCVTACGLVGGADIPVTVYPFILRGITLYGIDTATISPQYRGEIWQRLAGEWRLDHLNRVRVLIHRDQLENQIQTILAGGVAGRVVVALNSAQIAGDP